MVNILVTGGAGFIGSHLVDRLVSKPGHKVIVVDDLSTGNQENVNSKAELIESDIMKVDWSKILSDHNIDYVYHLAAQASLRYSLTNAARDAEINVLGTVRLLERCSQAGVRKFIYFSTGGAIYDENAKRPWIELSLINPLTKLNPQSPYGISKMCAEEYVKRMAKRYAILRPSNVYGPRQNPKGEAGVVAIFRDCILNGRPCHVFGDGEQTRDYIYIDDVIAAAEMCLTRISGTFNVSTGVETSLNHLAEMMYKAAKKKQDVCHDSPIAGEMAHSVLSNEWLRNTGWQPRWSLKDGIKRTMRV